MPKKINLSDAEIDCLFRNKKLNDGLTILRPVRPQPPVEFRTFDTVTDLEDHRFRYRRTEGTQVGRQWPPQPYLGFLPVYGTPGEVRRFGAGKDNLVIVERTKVLRVQNLMFVDMLCTAFEPSSQAWGATEASLSKTRVEFSEWWNARRTPRDHQVGELWHDNPWIWMIELMMPRVRSQYRSKAFKAKEIV